MWKICIKTFKEEQMVFIKSKVDIFSKTFLVFTAREDIADGENGMTWVGMI